MELSSNHITESPGSHPLTGEALNSLLEPLEWLFIPRREAKRQLAARRREITARRIDQLIECVAEVIRAKPVELKSPKRTQHLALQRAVAIYMVRRIEGASLHELARAFQRDHSTVHHAYKLIERRMAHETGFRLAVERFTAQVAGTALVQAAA
jgi:chromosomal replication initiator protein